jgi:hypothetical protein
MSIIHFSVTQDGYIEDVVVYGYQKRYDLEKRYCYILEVSRQHNPDKVYLFRYDCLHYF